jgi:hypothetical protein
MKAETLLQTGTMKIRVVFDETKLQLIYSPFGTLIKLEDCITLGEQGGPGLPSKIFRIALPSFSQVKEISGKPLKGFNIKIPKLVAPIQPPQLGVDREETSSSGDGQKEIKIKPSMFLLAKAMAHRTLSSPRRVQLIEELYNRELIESRPIVKLVTKELYGPVPVAVIEVNPMRLAELDLLNFYPEIEIDISYSEPPISELERNKFAGNMRSLRNARRLTAQAHSLVINPDLVSDIFDRYFSPQGGPIPSPGSESTNTDYLIITDDHTWVNTDDNAWVNLVDGNAIDSTWIGDKIEQRNDESALGLVDEFQRLADWKNQCGISARLITISDIMDKKFGDFSTNARDLQEILRNFIKFAHNNWNISWLLLGGDTCVIPARYALGYSMGELIDLDSNPKGKTDPPSIVGESHWIGSYKGIHIEKKTGVDWPGVDRHNYLVSQDNGSLIPYNSKPNLGKDSLGWYFTTNDAYDVPSDDPTEYVRVNGPEATIKGNLRWFFKWNMVPTDLYYASISIYPKNVLHDWDLHNNGIYGPSHELVASEDFDGVLYKTDISVGRAPVSNAREAKAFVNKIIAYETKCLALQSDSVKMAANSLMISSNWASYEGITSTLPGQQPKDSYQHNAGDPYTRIDYEWLEKAAVSTLRLFAVVNTTNDDLRLIPYDENAAINGNGWYFTTYSNNFTPSVVHFSGITIAKATRWVVVYSNDNKLLTPNRYYFDPAPDEDDSMRQEEEVRKQIELETEIKISLRLYEDGVDLSSQDSVTPPLGFLTNNNLGTELNAGPSFVSLSGHGRPDHTNAGLDIDMASNLSNSDNTFIAYLNSCLTNAFDMNNWIGKALICNSNGGAVGFMGFSRDMITDDLSNAFQKGFFHAIQYSRGGLDPSLLGTMSDSRCHVFNAWPGSLAEKKWHLLGLNLMGDPAMCVCASAKPSDKSSLGTSITVEYGWILFGRALSGNPLSDSDKEQLIKWLKGKLWPHPDPDIQIHVTDETSPDKAPVAGAMVEIHMGKISKVVTTNSSGIAVVAVQGLPEKIVITATRPGYSTSVNEFQLYG